MSVAAKCPVGCYECSDLCLCKCHRIATEAPLPMKFYDNLFDTVALKRKIFVDDLRGLRIYNGGMEKMIDFLFVRGYKLVGNCFIHD